MASPSSSRTPALAGPTVAAKRISAITDPQVDGCASFYASSPRENADMYGGFLVPADDDGFAHFGALF